VRLHPKALAVQGVAATALLAGTAAFVTLDKDLTVSVDGQSRQVSSYASTVGDVLDREGIEVDEHDSVVPALDRKVSDGDRIVVRNGRLLTLTVDGVRRQVWTTADTVEGALAALGVRAEGAFLSASRSRRIPLDGLALALRTPKAVVIAVDGRKIPLTSNAATVGAALAQAKVTLAPTDRTSPAVAAPLTAGQTITVTRVRTTQTTARVSVAYTTQRRADSDLYDGTERVVRSGRSGVKVVIYTDVRTDGRRTARTKVREYVAAQPVSRIVAYGTKDRPARSSSPSGGSGNSSSSSSARSSTGSGGLNWAALAACESGGDPSIVSASGAYHGLYQFSVSTWRSVGGGGLPSQASASEQTYRAQLLYDRSGASPWPTCGSRLFS
jgi:resuscitation-promoting factor RpfB